MADFWRGFRDGAWFAVKTFWPGVGLSLIVICVYGVTH